MRHIYDYWRDAFHLKNEAENWLVKKAQLTKSRDAEIVRTKARVRLFRKRAYDQNTVYDYHLHVQFFIKQGTFFYVEENLFPYELIIEGDNYTHKRQEPLRDTSKHSELKLTIREDLSREPNSYDRREAVRYAERWWNDYNPAYRRFTDDCTNYISQCLRAGGAPMLGAPNQQKGWWYSNGSNYSLSWTVSHSLRWYLSGSTTGLRGKELSSPKELLPGDVICYDFQGDDRWDHTTIVVAKDYNDMPLVNAHTNNSRMRYWEYEDSAAWTPNIQYKFFRIIV